MKKYIFLFIFLYLLVLLQTSFFVYFSINGFLFNFVWFFVFLLAVFCQRKVAIFSALYAGFFLDVFSSIFFGFNILILLIVVFLTRRIMSKYIDASILKIFD